MPESPNVETRLEAMERRLAEIQQELAPDVRPPVVPEPAPGVPARSVAEPAPDVPAPSVAEPAPDVPAPSVAEPARDVPAPSVAEPARDPDAAPSPSPAVEVSAGPFPSMDALREFERAVAALPGVREVMVRGYESGNRAILEVQLSPETP